MNLKGLISISGKPGLYKVVGQGKERLIVESLTDGKRMPAFASQKISALEDITMYTTDDDLPLGEIIQKIFDKEEGKACVNPNEDASKLHAYFGEVVPNYDKERVYNSDLKKLFVWYNLLQSTGTLDKIIAETKEAAASTEVSEEKTEKKSAKSDASTTLSNPEDKEEKPAKKTAKSGDKKVAKTKTAAPKVKANVNAKAATTRKINAPKRGA